MPKARHFVCGGRGRFIPFPRSSQRHYNTRIMELQRARVHVPRGDFRLAGLLVEPSLGRISCGAVDVHVRPKLMDVLAFLSTRAGSVVSKNELLDAVWPQQYVDETALTRAIADLRQLLEGDLGQARLIETIPKRGYRLLAAPGPPERLASVTGSPAGSTAVPLPFDLTQTAAADREPRAFVAREAELARLAGFLASARAGRGRVAFVTGDVGTGKTACLLEFSRRALAADANLVVASGRGQAHTGVGDPYLPFRHVLGMLTGDLESHWAEGTVTRDQMTRLWQLVPAAAEILSHVGPDLVDTFVPGRPLVARAGAWAGQGAPWLGRLQALVDRHRLPVVDAGPSQADLFGQFVDVLHDLARHRTFVLLLDDLQWADTGSLGLLFHLGRELTGHRILVVGAYRATDLAFGREGTRHPLEAVVHELVRDHGDSTVALPQAGDQAFIDALIDREPNRIGPSFRSALYARTAGHPLFTIELLRSLEEDGAIRRDDQGRWVEGPATDSTAWPARVESAIEERVARLPVGVRKVLTVASVEGDEFTAEVVATVAGTDAKETVLLLGGELGRRHQLVKAVELLRTGDRRLSLYRFQHTLVQRFLYDSLDVAERAYLHESVGAAIESLFEGRVDEVAVRLAHHFELCGNGLKAIRYLITAGERSLRVSADEEAVGHFKKALELIRATPVSPMRNALELELLLKRLAVEFRTSDAAAALGPACDRARLLCDGMPDHPQLLHALAALLAFDAVRGNHASAADLAGRAVGLARRLQAPALELLIRTLDGPFRLRRGEFVGARADLEQPIPPLAAEDGLQAMALTGVHPEVWRLTWLAYAMWMLGYPDQALSSAREARRVAEGLNHTFSALHALVLHAVVHLHRREGTLAQPLVETALQTTSSYGFAFYRFLSTLLQGWALMETGRAADSVEPLRRLVHGFRHSVLRLDATKCAARFAEACARTDRVDEGLAAVAEGLAFAREHGEIYYAPELFRIQGVLLLQSGREAEAEQAFVEGLAAARATQGKSWELKLAIDLAHLWQKHGKRAQAAAQLGAVVGWFTEGFDTPDMQDANALLAALASDR